MIKNEVYFHDDRLSCVWDGKKWRIPMESKGLGTVCTRLHPESNEEVLTEVRSTSRTGGQKGVKLDRHDLIPIGPLVELAKHFGRGALKYDEHQWRKGYEWSKSYSAIQRHLTAFWGGEDYDTCPENGAGCSSTTAIGEVFLPQGKTCYNHIGSHHMVAVAWHSFVLLEFKETFPDLDDRYIRSKKETK